jgi:hypothetical protein
MTGILDSRVAPLCDQTSHLCELDLTLTIVATINVATDPAFTSGFAQGNADSVRDVNLQYTISDNANFDISKVDVYNGPNGIVSPTDAGVSYIGTIGPVAAGGALTDKQQPLVIVDGSPAHDQVIDNIRNPQSPFTFLMVALVRGTAGDPFPRGTLDIRTQPVVKLLNR